MKHGFELQGHRGARGLKPENTLPSFEAAFDAGVTSIETDIHLTRDDVPVLIHDPALHPLIFRSLSGSPPRVRALTLAELRRYRADGNADPARFPHQDASVTPVAQAVADRAGIDPYAVPTVSDLLALAAAYAGEIGQAAGKSAVQRERVSRTGFDLELKRVPYAPENIGDDFTGAAPGLLERCVVDLVRQAGVLERTTVRSFDHRSVAAVHALEPRLSVAILASNTAPLHPGKLARQAGAEIYGPDFRFLDELAVRQAHEEGVRVIPWTVNEARDWQRLLDWGVDGITTDYPDRLARHLDRP
jgi:glycerophosphoryl diester phosphodiesterase